MLTTDLQSNVFCIPLESGTEWIVYAPLHRIAFIANAAMVNRFASHFADADGSDNELISWFSTIGLSGEGNLDSESFDGDPCPTSITLFLTTACNLRCTYCYASAGDHPAEFLDAQTAQRGIDVVIGNAISKGVDRIDIAFHGGGEPSTAWETLTNSLDYARSAGAQFGITAFASITTNGVMSEEKARWVAENLNYATISCDGLPEVQDRNRLTVIGSGSSPALFRTLSIFDAAGFPYAIRMTVTERDTALLPQSVEHLCSEYNPRAIQAEPVYLMGRGSAEAELGTTSFLDAFRAARGHAESHGSRLVFSAARLDVRSRHFCGVTRDTFGVAPGGGVSACYEVFSREDKNANTFFYGALTEDGLKVDFSVLSELRRQTVDARKPCESCFAKWNCSGDCYHKVLLAGGDDFSGSERCTITRELLKDELVTRIAATGGLLWRGETFCSAANEETANATHPEVQHSEQRSQ